jgi:hypothetical protein
MTLITAIIVGLACGYFLGLRPKGFIVFGAIWSVMLMFQTFVALDKEDIPPEAWAYVPVQIVILGVGAAMLWLGTRLRTRVTSTRLAKD